MAWMSAFRRDRLAPNTLPAMAKAGANYMNSQLIKMEAIANGYVEGIALDRSGFVSEGSGENLFIVHRDKLITAPLGSSVLPGITRDSVLQIARDLNIPMIEQMIPREMLYIADEVFFTGTAAEVTPIRSVDKIKVGKGTMGPVTKAIQKEFYAIVHGEKNDRHGWFTPVPCQQAASRGIIRFVESLARGARRRRPLVRLSPEKKKTDCQEGEVLCPQGMTPDFAARPLRHDARRYPARSRMHQACAGRCPRR